LAALHFNKLHFSPSLGLDGKHYTPCQYLSQLIILKYLQ